MGKPKHIRVNKDRRNTAERVVGLWYVGQCEERQERYRSVNAIPVTPSGSVNQLSDRWKAWTTQFQQRTSSLEYLTVTAKEKHIPNPDAPALTKPMDLDSKGGYHPNRNLQFAQRIMRHVLAVDPAAYDTLEMNAAGYDRKGISKELQCSEPVADSYKNSGLAIVMSCILLKQELGWLTNDGKKPNPYLYT